MSGRGVPAAPSRGYRECPVPLTPACTGERTLMAFIGLLDAESDTVQVRAIQLIGDVLAYLLHYFGHWIVPIVCFLRRLHDPLFDRGRGPVRSTAVGVHARSV